MASNYPRLLEAFMLMRDSGLKARQNHLCCSTCASTDLHQKVVEEGEHGSLGYAFYHEQDAEGLKRDRAVYIGFGSVTGDDADDEEIGHIVASSARAAGLTVEWNESPHTKVLLKGF